MPSAELFRYGLTYLFSLVIIRCAIFGIFTIFPAIPANGSAISVFVAASSSYVTLRYFIHREHTSPFGRDYWYIVIISSIVFVLSEVIIYIYMLYMFNMDIDMLASLLIFSAILVLSLLLHMVSYSSFAARRLLR
ncbi:ABZJ_00895 family protein [Aurantimonas sp. HBX-1]|uniref:ABZJ_00895 family protein n=1 Tax=Aurantimonas sp. HBX-1 TaxID=2906072 RepID=UPI00351D9EBF